MNKKVSYVISLFLVLVVTACGSTAPAESDQDPGGSVQSDVSNDSETGAGRLNEGFGNALPISAKLGFGTLMLENTDLAVSPSQAVELLPLWKAARSLSESETVAQAELEAVYDQIQESMTPEQLAAIDEMEFSGEEMAQLAEDLGLTFGFGGGPGFENLSPEQQATAQAAMESEEGFPGGGFPGGGFPGGGEPGGQGPGGFPGGGQLSPEQQATLEARRAERGNSGARFSLIFADPLIELLEERAIE